MSSRPAPQIVPIAAATLGAVLIVIGLYGLKGLATDENVRLMPWLVVLLGLIAVLNGLGALLRARVDEAARPRTALPSEPPLSDAYGPDAYGPDGHGPDGQAQDRP